MKIHVETKPNIQEVEVIVVCKEKNKEVDRILSILNIMEERLRVRKNQENFFVQLVDILYIDTVDKKVFVYTKEQVYETDLKLYELEDRFEFFRISKSCVVNLNQIHSLQAESHRRIKIMMSNSEKIIVSRQYAKELKNLLGVK